MSIREKNGGLYAFNLFIPLKNNKTTYKTNKSTNVSREIRWNKREKDVSRETKHWKTLNRLYNSLKKTTISCFTWNNGLLSTKKNTKCSTWNKILDTNLRSRIKTGIYTMFHVKQSKRGYESILFVSNLLILWQKTQKKALKSL